MDKLSYTVEVWYEDRTSHECVLHSSFVFDGLTDDDQRQNRVDLTVESLRELGHYVWQEVK